MSEADCETVVRRVLLAVVKARSIAAENDTLEAGSILDPALYGTEDLSLLTVCERMLDNRKVTAGDAMNVLFLAGRSEGVRQMYALRWEEDLPEPMSVFS